MSARGKPLAEARLRRLLDAARRQARADLLRAWGVAGAGITLTLVSMLAAPASDLAETLLRVHALGLLGLGAACWGVALADAAAARLSDLRALPALLAEGHYARAFARLAAAGE